MFQLQAHPIVYNAHWEKLLQLLQTVDAGNVTQEHLPHQWVWQHVRTAFLGNIAHLQEPQHAHSALHHVQLASFEQDHALLQRLLYVKIAIDVDMANM
jgi:hypothetical protein